MGFDQFPLYEEREASLELSPCGGLRLRETETAYILTSDRIRYVFGKKTGTFLSLEKDGKPLMDAPMAYSVFRAPADNDSKIIADWLEAGYDRPQLKVKRVSACLESGEGAGGFSGVKVATGAEETAGVEGIAGPGPDKNAPAEGQKAVICCEFCLAAVYRQPFLRVKSRWEVDASGGILLKEEAEKDPGFPYLPRFGLTFTLPEKEVAVSYLGYGPYESYQDKHRASYMGRFKTTVGEMHEDYVRPQENGSHYHCLDVQVGAMRARGREPISMNASFYTVEELASKAHNYDLQKSGHVIVHLDYGMSGVGSSSCGPELQEQYRLDGKQMRWELRLDWV